MIITLDVPEAVCAQLSALNGPPERALADFVAWLAYTAAAYSTVARGDVDGAAILANAAHAAADKWRTESAGE